MTWDSDSRLGQVWHTVEAIELIVSARPPEGRITETRWDTLVLWASESNMRRVGEQDGAGESAFAAAERGERAHRDWKRLL